MRSFVHAFVEPCNDRVPLLEHNGHYLVGYADDSVILVYGKYNNVAREMQQVLRILTRWPKEGLGLKLRGDLIQLAGKVKYLGVILDPKLTWHLDRVKRKDRSRWYLPDAFKKIHDVFTIL